MCGITGFAGINPNPMMMSAMIDSIKHRGPDSDGYILHDDMGIGMTRLSIVDLQGGTQPINSDTGFLSIVFNGEIYNHNELAIEYKEQGGRLKTRSDTEVILSLYQNLGPKCLEKLRGMFCFAILDRRDNSIFIARDRVGIKPLYYWNEGSKLVFSSEIKSILASNQVRAEANSEALVKYLTLRYVPGPGSLFQGIQRLDPGHCMKWQAGKLIKQCYWKTQIRDKKSFSTQEFQEQFDYLFEQSVDLRKMGDVSYGAYLSSGLDSGAIVNALSTQVSKKLSTFTVGFGWEGDELKQARETAKILNTDHHEIIFKSEDFQNLPKIIWHSDEPLGDPIVLPTYMLASEASKRVKVVLSGEGADEILAGYLFHKAIYLAGKYQRNMPNSIHRFGIMPLIKHTPVGVLNAGFNYPGYLGKDGKKRLLSFLELTKTANIENLFQYFISLFDADEKKKILNKDYFTNVEWENQIWETKHSEVNSLDRLLQIQYNDWLPDNILMRQDKMSMAHGLEVRVPFLDHNLIEFMETVPNRLKLNLFQNKVLLRNYIKKTKVSTITKRKKNAFYFPMEEYFKDDNFQNLLFSTLGEKAIKNRGLLNIEYVNTLLDEMANKNFLASKKIFALMSLELWFQVFIDKKYSY
jgi:asparagine synthase (glutamine-hydrolysing)